MVAIPDDCVVLPVPVRFSTRTQIGYWIDLPGVLSRDLCLSETRKGDIYQIKVSAYVEGFDRVVDQRGREVEPRFRYEAEVEIPASSDSWNPDSSNARVVFDESAGRLFVSAVRPQDGKERHLPAHIVNRRPNKPKDATVQVAKEISMPTAPLSTPAKIVQKLAPEAIDAAWRMARMQFVKNTKEPTVALLLRHLAPDDESMRAKLAAFLDTDLGTALFEAVLSVGLSALPTLPGLPTARLAQELRIDSMARVGDSVADVVMGPLRQIAVMYLQGMPPTDPILSELPDATGAFACPTTEAPVAMPSVAERPRRKTR